MAGGGEGGHVKGLTHMPSAAVDGAGSTHFAAIAVQGGNAHQERDLLPRALSQFREAAQESTGGLGTDPRHASEDLILVAPRRAFLDALIDVSIDSFELLIEGLQEGLDAF